MLVQFRIAHDGLTCHRPSPNLGDFVTLDLASPLLGVAQTVNGNLEAKRIYRGWEHTCFQTDFSGCGESIQNGSWCSP